MYRCDAGTSCWDKLIDPPRKTHPCVVSDEEHIYVIGGGTHGIHVLTTTSRYNPSYNNWEEVASLNEGRYSAFGAAMDGKIYVVGGTNGDGEQMNSCEVYNPSSDEWQMMPSLKVPRHKASMVCCEGRLYVLGGVVRTQLHNAAFSYFSLKRSLSVEEFDSEWKEWVEKSVIPVERFETSEEKEKEKKFQACFLRLYKQVIDKLKPLN